MDKITRFGVSIEKSLIGLFDAEIAKTGYRNRSEAIRDLMRDWLVGREWSRSNERAMGVITIVYDHHTRDLQEKLTEIQHGSLKAIVSTLHVHMDHDNCLEVIVLRGKTGEIQRLADALGSIRGVKHCKLLTTTTGSHIH